MTHELVFRQYEDDRTIRYVHVFYGLELAGLVGAVIMLLTAMIWPKVARRNASWLNFMVTWIISCSSYLFLIGVPLGQKPNHTLCLLQATLIYSVPTLTSGATFALVVQVYITLRSLLTAPTNRDRSPWTTALVVGPYVPAWAMFVYTLKVGLDDPSSVYRHEDGAYCGLATNMPQRVSGIVVAIIMILCLGVEVIIFRHLWRTWATLKRDNRSSVSIIVRVLAFTLVGMLSIILSVIFLALPYDQDIAFNIVIAMVPVSSVVIFGTQKDIFAAWGSGFREPRTHLMDTWDTFTPNESRATTDPQVSEA